MKAIWLKLDYVNDNASTAVFDLFNGQVNCVGHTMSDVTCAWNKVFLLVW